MKFNTSVSALMILSNALGELDIVPRSVFETFLKLLAPFAPHLTEELWHELGHTNSIHTESWPAYDPSKLEADTVTIAIQVNGKLKGTIEVSRTANQDEVLSLIQTDPALHAKLPSEWSKIIYIPSRILNIIS